MATVYDSTKDPYARGGELQVNRSGVAVVPSDIRELGELERLRSLAFDELKADANNRNQMASCVRNSTRFQLELRTQISMMRGMKLNPPFAELPAQISEFNEKRIDLYNRMGEGCATILAGPKPNIDYGAVAAEVPKITAELGSGLIKPTIQGLRPDRQRPSSFAPAGRSALRCAGSLLIC
jgi:hypothetical protein